MCDFFIGESLVHQQRSDVERRAGAYAQRHPAPVIGTAAEPASVPRVSFWRRSLRLVLAHG